MVDEVENASLPSGWLLSTRNSINLQSREEPSSYASISVLVVAQVGNNEEEPCQRNDDVRFSVATDQLNANGHRRLGDIHRPRRASAKCRFHWHARGELKAGVRGGLALRCVGHGLFDASAGQALPGVISSTHCNAKKLLKRCIDYIRYVRERWNRSNSFHTVSA